MDGLIEKTLKEIQILSFAGKEMYFEIYQDQ